MSISNTYAAATGQAKSISATSAATSGKIHQYTLGYDSYGNLTSQSSNVTAINASESYVYDELHRLTNVTIRSGNTAISSNVAGCATTVCYGYDSVGNFKKKSDYSTHSNTAYQYTSNTNKVSSVSLKGGGQHTFGYDNKGNLTKRNTVQEVWYNVFNKPTTIDRDNVTLNFVYGADLSRYKQTKTANNKTVTVYYADKHYEKTVDGNNWQSKTYIGDIAIISDGNQTSDKAIHFTLRDRLGSTTTFVKDTGQVSTYRQFDAFGKPRGGDWKPLSESGLAAKLVNNAFDNDMPTWRGFTDHEHLDSVELIHMNGRVYDYNLGRFLSVDPIIQGVGNSQGINPYSYIMNNPLSGTDPTGYAIEEETRTLRQKVTGSNIKRAVGTKTTSTVTDDDTGEVTNKTTTVVMKNGTFGFTSQNYSNGKNDSVIIGGGNFKAGTGESASFEIGSPKGIATSSNIENSINRSTSRTDGDGNSYSWRVNSIYAGSPEGAWGLIQGAQNSGEGYFSWVEAGGDKSFLDHPLFIMGASLGSEALPIMRIAGNSLKSLSPSTYALVHRSIEQVKSGFNSLRGTDRRSFLAKASSDACGLVLICAAQLSPMKPSPRMPSLPPSFNNGINYLHKWYDTQRPIMLQTIDKVK